MEQLVNPFLVESNKDFVVGSSFIILSPNNRVILSNYFQKYVSSIYIKDSSKAFVKGTGIPRLSIFNFGRLNTLLPPLPEQTIIANYLDQKIKVIDQKINLLTKKN